MRDTIYTFAKKVPTSRTGLCIQIFLVFILPILLIQLGILPLHYRIWILVGITTLLVAILIHQRWTLTMLGISTHAMQKACVPYAFFTTVAVLGIALFGEGIGREEMSHWWMHGHFLYGFFITSLFQEIAYRGYLIPALAKIIPKRSFVIIANAFLFMILHSIFPTPALGLPLAFVGGMGFAFMYLRYPNLPLIIVSHAIINFFVVLYGFFMVPGMI